MDLRLVAALAAGLVCVIFLPWILLAKKQQEARELKNKYDLLAKSKKELEKQCATLAAEEQGLKSLVAKTKKDLSQLKVSTSIRDKQEKWCNTALLPLPIGTPRGLHDHTLSLKEDLLSTPKSQSLYELHRQKNFVTTGSWELYWCLAHAAQAAIFHCEIKVEDSITNEFILALKKNVALLPSLTPHGQPVLEMAHCAIYDGAVPCLKEADVGADLLLVVGGNGLVSGGGARLLWIQAKKAAKNDGAYILDCSHKNSKGLQLDALKKVAVPEMGSMAIYILYSSKLAFIPALSVINQSPSSEEKKVDLAIHGFRFQELATALLLPPLKNIGKFSAPVDVIEFINNKGNNKPLHIVSITGDDAGRWIAKDFISQLEHHYRKELNLPHSHDYLQNRENKKDRDFGMGM